MKMIKVLFSVAFLASIIALSGCSSESAPATTTPTSSEASSDAKPAASDEKGGEEAKKAASDEQSTEDAAH